ncbi:MULTISPECIES: SDR family oxidoreductase [Arthrobacter]|uniref:SDR family oxidoreductase n=2 Tax=Arthrobacter TaxID=1663 RepID=A0ABU9KJR2_9MICC|nr:SDR family oxidoreductase [Arthrobacter sp. YJM1]MDP5226725.1 SDR family oxidoreductase [Arthrobacter sp. YJM1]
MVRPTHPRRIASVTGGASGIGLAFAQRWVDDGGAVVLLDLNADAFDDAVEHLGGPDKARGCTVDVTDARSVAAAFASIAEQEGRLDAAVNCAGIARPAPSSEVSDKDFVRLVDIHLHGTMRACQAAYPLLKESNGSIVNISSVAASSGMPARASYCASKAGIEGLTRTLAVEWAPDSVRVNAVGPGYTRTALTEKLMAEGKLDVSPLVARTPLGRLADPREIAAAINFLVSEDASYITGQSLLVDGGMTVDGNWY